MLLKSKCLGDSAVVALLNRVNYAYAGNLTIQSRPAGRTRDGGEKTRFTLGVHDSYAFGARMSGSGRHMPKASWQAHRDLMEAIFAADPDAVLVTALATYKGREDFLAKFPATGARNVGTRMQPVCIEDTAV